MTQEQFKTAKQILDRIAELKNHLEIESIKFGESIHLKSSGAKLIDEFCPVEPTQFRNQYRQRVQMEIIRLESAFKSL